MPETKKEPKALADMASPSANQPEQESKPSYSYGLRCSLGTEELKKLGMSELPAPGDTLEGQVRFKVLGASTEGEGEEARHNVSLQITHLAVDDGGEEDEDEEDEEGEGGGPAGKKLFGGKKSPEGSTGE